MLEAISHIDNGGNQIAYQASPGRSPGVFFLPGYGSDMTGTKAQYIADKAAREGFAFTRLDYAGHGQSGGNFKSCTLATWLSDALTVFDAATRGPQILVGSSMGGWLALHLALARPNRVVAIIGIAAAPDFTQRLAHEYLNDRQRAQMDTLGYVEEPSEYGPPLIFTRDLIQSGQDLLLLPALINIACPIYLLHGMQDKSVPWATSLRIAEAVTSNDVEVHLIKDGAHRLSRTSDLALLGDVLNRLRA